VQSNKNIKPKIIYLASDHAGFNLKEDIKKLLIKKNKKVSDLGPFNSSNSVDYPDFAHKLSKKIKNNNEFGVLICGSGIGMIMTANKYKNIRATLCYNVKSAKLSREHNNANVISIGSRLTKKKLALECINTFFKTKFKGGRHLRRVKKI
jgi:ribose 5-phosphate isomerase B